MKKLLSGLLTIVMFVALLGTLALIGVRNAIAPGNIEKLVDTLIDDYNFLENVGDVGVDELEELMEEDKEFKKIFSETLSETLKYTASISNEMPDYEVLIEYMADETDIEVDKDDIEMVVEELEEKIEMERISEDDESVPIIQTIFSTGLLIGSFIVVVLCAVGICVLTKDVGKGVKRLGCTAAVAGLAIYGLSTLLLSFASQQASESEEAVVGLIEVIVSPFGTIGVISIVIGIILAILSPKIAQTFTSIDLSNQAIENLDNTVIKR